MHSSAYDDLDSPPPLAARRLVGAEVFASLASLVTEGRVLPEGKLAPGHGLTEGPHCAHAKASQGHVCNLDNTLCIKFEKIHSYVWSLWQKSLPLCIDVLLVPKCCCETDLVCNPSTSLEPIDTAVLLEQWHINVQHRRLSDCPTNFNINQLINAIRSQLYFSQISAWFATSNEEIRSSFRDKTIVYCLTVPGETYGSAKFTTNAQHHNFPSADLGNGLVLNVSLATLPRTQHVPPIKCSKCDVPLSVCHDTANMAVLDDRMQMSCTLKGKHRCDDYDEFVVGPNRKCDIPRSKVDLELSRKEFVEVLTVLRHNKTKQSKGDILLDAILRSSKHDNMANKRKCAMHRNGGVGDHSGECVRNSDNTCDTKLDSTFSDKSYNSNSDSTDVNCDNVKRKKTGDISNVFSVEYLQKRHKVKVKQKITFEDNEKSYFDRNCTSVKETNQSNGIPSALEQAKFRKNLDSAASMVFHSRTGLPLTSSPAPVRRGKSCFDFDSSINSVSAIRSALFSLSNSADEDSESDCSIVSPCSPDSLSNLKPEEVQPIKYRHRGQSSGLLGSFVESVLNGRLEPVSTVQGFSAELGASGSFCPRHVVLPVTVFFYTLGDNDKVSTPYLGHINLGKKGYNVPKSGTIQVTLFNPLGTVVKMFVIMYDLSDMPPNTQTFIRQRTLFMPASCEEKNLEFSHKWLRYLIHLRFMSSKSGRIYLHSDIRMIICRKSDLDTATAHGMDMSYELRSFTNSPTNPKFSPRK